MYQAVVSAMNHPDPHNPYMGLFNARSIRSLASHGVDLDVVSPRPIAPPIGPYSEYNQVPSKYDYEDYEVSYPRFAYLLPQKLFKYNLSSRAIAYSLPKYLAGNVRPPDICHAGHIHYDGYGLLPYCRKHDIPLTVMGHGKILNNYHDMSEISKQKIQETLEFADGILCVSESLAGIAKEIVSDSKTTVLAIGADPSNYQAGKKTAIKQELNIDPETTVVLFCGGYTERKGIREICAAIDDVHHENVKFVFIGNYGELQSELVQSLRHSPHESYEVLSGIPQQELHQWFTVADIFMLPSHREGRPTTIYESMASETAVVASAVSGIPEQVADEETGLLIPPKDPAGLSSALNQLITNEALRDQMGTNGLRRLVSKGWTWDAHGERLADIHTSIIDGDGVHS